MMEQTLTILYTASLRGDLDLMPRLHTFLRRVQQNMTGRVLKLDSGNACDPAAWHCAATGGRSVLLVLDAMGFTAANVSGVLTAEGRAKLADNLMGLALLDEGDVWEDGGVLLTTTGQPPTRAHDLHIVLACADVTALEARRLHLAGLDAGQVGMVQLGRAGENGRLTITRQEILALPAATLPEPTIAATVEFVLSEARTYRDRHGGQ